MDKVDILYIVGKGFSEWDNNELRYSLRSLAKYGKNIRRVYVCGYCPYWLNKEEVTCIPLKDETENKHYNILTAIEYSVHNSDIGEFFLYSSDDHYYVQPTDFATYPVYWRGYELPEELQGKRWYDITMKSTHDVLAAFGLPTHFYAWHGNTWYCKSLFLQQRMELLRRLSKTMPEACDPACLMLNYWKAVSPETMPTEIARADFKISAHNEAEIEQLSMTKEVLSTTDAVREGMRRWLEKRFPHRCKYERE